MPHETRPVLTLAIMDVDKLGKLSAMIGVVAIITEIIGFATRGWIRFKLDIPLDPEFGTILTGIPGMSGGITWRYEFGLWAASVCLNNVCAAVQHTDWGTDESVRGFAEVLDIPRYQVIASLAIGVGVVGMLFLVFHVRRPVLANKCYGLLSLGSFVVTGALLWYVVGKFAKLASNLHPTLSLPDGLTAMAPYSVIITAIGASLSFVVAALTLVEVLRTSCVRDGGIIINKNPFGHQHTLLNINHQTNALPAPPMLSQTTHIGVTIQNPRM